MSSEQILKKSMLGGFKKEGVLNYVEQLQNEIVSLKKEVSNGSKCQTELDELKDKKDSADRELSALKAEIEALKSENARLIEQNAAYALKLEEANVSIADYESRQQLFVEKISSIEAKFDQIESNYIKYGEVKAFAASACAKANDAVKAAKADIAGANERIKTACVNFESSVASLKASSENLIGVLDSVSESLVTSDGEEA
ncbi:MAG: hypothetical protein IJF57_00250 [Clostridia bacterium]|nr:hypothetical protein [Clostridia bacterium]